MYLSVAATRTAPIGAGSRPTSQTQTQENPVVLTRRSREATDSLAAIEPPALFTKQRVSPVKRPRGHRQVMDGWMDRLRFPPATRVLFRLRHTLSSHSPSLRASEHARAVPAAPGAVERGEDEALRWRCLPCKMVFSSAVELRTHTLEHASCLPAGHSFSASKEIVLSHIVAAHASSSRQATEHKHPTMTDKEYTPMKRESASPAAVRSIPGDGYCCRICNIPGHWLLDCPAKLEPRYGPRTLAYSRTTGSQYQLNLVQTTSCSPTASVTEADSSLGEGAFWHCESCDAEFGDELQWRAHLG